MYERKAQPKQYRPVDRERKVADMHRIYAMGEFTKSGSNYTPRNRAPMDRQEKIQHAYRHRNH